jgi:transcriptional regulator with XRE-family HTH domain
MELNVAFGQSLRFLRKRNLMAQDNLGPQAFISRIERGTKEVNLGTVERLAERLGMHPLELFARAISWQSGSDPVELLRALANEIEQRNGEPPRPPRSLTSPPL